MCILTVNRLIGGGYGFPQPLPAGGTLGSGVGVGTGVGAGVGTGVGGVVGVAAPPPQLARATAKKAAMTASRATRATGLGTSTFMAWTPRLARRLERLRC